MSSSSLSSSVDDAADAASDSESVALGAPLPPSWSHKLQRLRSSHNRRCVAYCTATQYKLKHIEKLFENPSRSSKKAASHYRHFVRPLPELNPNSEVFFFPVGTFVAWNVSAEEEKLLLKRLPADLLGPGAHVSGNTMPTDAIREDYQFIQLSSEELATAEAAVREATAAGEEMQEVTTNIEHDVILLASHDLETKLAVSIALSASVRTSVLEATGEHIMERVIRQVQTEELTSGKWREMFFGGGARRAQKKALSAYRNTLLGLKTTQLGLSGDSDYFWDHAGKNEHIYRTFKSYLDIKNRTRVVGEMGDHALGLIQSLMDDSKHQHSIRLELIIIALIFVEVIFNLVDHADWILHKSDALRRLLLPRPDEAPAAPAPPPPPKHGKH